MASVYEKVLPSDIAVTNEQDHYLLSYNGKEVRCDPGELREAKIEFADLFNSTANERRVV